MSICIETERLILRQFSVDDALELHGICNESYILKWIQFDDLAKLIVQVNSRTINNYFQQIRRRISILERPLVTGRGDGKSYIYANYNPKYAQYVITIFRTVYGFCWATKSNGEPQIPAQRLGITDKIYEYKDIIYFR